MANSQDQQDQQDQQDYQDYLDYHNYLAQSQPGVMNDYVKPAGGLVQSALNRLDAYTDAPTRAAIGGALDAPGLLQAPGAAVGAFMNQFGEDPSTAPTGKQLNAKAGINLPEKPIPPISPLVAGLNAAGFHPTWNDAAGAMTDAIANWTNVVPAEQISGLVAKGSQAVAPYVAKPLAFAGETVTGIAKPLIQEFYTNTQDIKNLIQKYGGATAEYASDLRKNWQNIIQNYRKTQNDHIGDVLNDYGISGQKIPADEINQSLLKDYGKTNATTQQVDRKSIADLMSKLDQMTDDKGYITLGDLHAFKKYAYQNAEGIFDAIGNKVFPGGDWAAKTANNAGDVARSLLIDNAPYQITRAEANLHDLHTIDDIMNPNLVKPEGPAQAIMNAGANLGGREARTLIMMKDLTGYDFVKDARQFATTRAFSDANFVPIDTTGKTVARQAIGKGMGKIAGAAVGLMADKGNGSILGNLGGAYLGSRIGQGIGQFVTSPWALKQGIQAADAAGKRTRGLLKLANPAQAAWGLLNK